LERRAEKVAPMHMAIQYAGTNIRGYAPAQTVVSEVAAQSLAPEQSECATPVAKESAIPKRTPAIAIPTTPPNPGRPPVAFPSTNPRRKPSHTAVQAKRVIDAIERFNVGRNRRPMSGAAKLRDGFGRPR
jgi:hypothetical protein